jgi:TRAP-type C4-dicarboxylate transport system permease small subunit
VNTGAPALAPPITDANEIAWAELRRCALIVDRAIGTVAEALGAGLVVTETCILFAGVVSRYVFNRPLMWTDELANFLFLWLAMLGAVVALRRGEHMRLTTFVNSLGPQWGRLLGAVGALVVIVFVLEILLPATQYLEIQKSTELITLSISDGYRVVAILVGATLTAAIALLRLLETTTWRGFLLAVALVAAVALALWLAQPLLIAMGHASLILFFVVLVAACVMIGVPIAFTFGIATFSYLALTTDLPLVIVVNRMDDGISNLLLLAVPMFVVLGLLMEMTGIARVMVNFLAALVGHVKGGLSYVLLGAMYLVSGISGSKAADMAAVAPILFPEMRRRGSHPGELASLLATSSAMSETIPPSLVLITIGSVTNISIAALFTGGLLPAAVAALRAGHRRVVPLARRRSRGWDEGAGAPSRQDFCHRGSGADLAVCDPRRGHPRGRNRHRGLDRRRRLHRAFGPPRLPSVRLAPDLPDPRRYRFTDRRRHADHRHRDGDGLGLDAVRVFAMARLGYGRRAGRHGGFLGDHDRRVHHSRQRSRRPAGDRAVRPVVVPGRQDNGRP